MTRYNGTFTASDAQTLAVRLLDGVCDALDRLGKLNGLLLGNTTHWDVVQR